MKVHVMDKHLLWILVLVYSFILSVKGTAYDTKTCPEPCHCTYAQTHTVVNCQNKDLTSIPDLDEIESDSTPVDILLSGNRISHLLGISFWPVRQRLRMLEIVENSKKIEISLKTFTGLTNLKILNLSPIQNNLNEEMEIFAETNSLQDLRIETVSSEERSLIGSLINGTKKSHLRVLHVCNSGIISVDENAFRGLALFELGLGFNKMRTFPLAVIKMMTNTLRILRIDGNRLSSLKSGHFPDGCKLTVLHLQQNQIQIIEPGSLDKCSGLKELNLAENKLLVSIDPSVFLGFRDLSLDISNTGLTFLGFLDVHQLWKLKAYDIHVPCDCKVIACYLKLFADKLNGSCIDWKTENIHDIRSYNLRCQQKKDLDTNSINIPSHPRDCRRDEDDGRREGSKTEIGSHQKVDTKLTREYLELYGNLKSSDSEYTFEDSVNTLQNAVRSPKPVDEPYVIHESLVKDRYPTHCEPSSFHGSENGRHGIGSRHSGRNTGGADLESSVETRGTLSSNIPELNGLDEEVKTKSQDRIPNILKEYEAIDRNTHLSNKGYIGLVFLACLMHSAVIFVTLTKFCNKNIPILNK